jgi:transposase
MNLLEFGKPDRLPKVLSIDEFRGNTEYGKFQCVLTDPVHKRIVDILPTRYHAQIYEYLRTFSSRNQVQYFVMDMNREYLDIARKLLPNAQIVIDRFHVVRYCTWALENVRKRVQTKLLPEQRKYFKRSRKLLLAHMRNLSAENKAVVERMLLIQCDLREAYLLKEKFYDFMDSSDSLQAKERLRAFRVHAFVADLPEFAACLTMLKNWEPFILNAFDCPYSNGFTEGVNNKIKVLKRIAFGYRSFKNFRTRILCTNNA